MSTFNGLMPEFPDIRVDYFRTHVGLRPPLACFLSHVHSDHLVGLENLRSPFVYCSAATKDLLLRLERYPHRLNFARGILESRKQQYKHLKNLLRPIPLETPTWIELEPGNRIQVTLFDANHCTGAVMFLIEGNGSAILYTGDIRSEPWFVKSLARNPFLIEYVTGLKTLDCIYLDTTNVTPEEFPSKAEGLKELLQKVSQYPPHTTFHFAAWTFGYEQVWMALSHALNSPIHVDKYKLQLYQSLGGDNDKKLAIGSHAIQEAAVLAGYTCGNAAHLGCLTSDTNVRLHSCERGMRCASLDEKTVWIEPIIARTAFGTEVAEIGIGGGGSDLNQHPEVELDGEDMIERILAVVAKPGSLPGLVQEVKAALEDNHRIHRNLLPLKEIESQQANQEMSIVDFLEVLARLLHARREKKKESKSVRDQGAQTNSLPKIITFPYSRHSSYQELCHLVSAFKPRDVFPCTVDESRWHEGISMQTLFSDHCAAGIFRHDAAMRELRVQDENQRQCEQQSQTTEISSQPSYNTILSSPTRTIAFTNAEEISQQQSSARVIATCHAQQDTTQRSKLLGARDREFIASPPSQPGTISRRESLGISPGSASQAHRRRIIGESVDWTPSKRPRFDGPSSAPCFTVAEIPGNGTAEKQSQSAPPQFMFARPMADSLHREDKEPEQTGDDSHHEEDEDDYWDERDEVFRCGKCDYELWGTAISIGHCDNCDDGNESTAYRLEFTDRDIPIMYANSVTDEPLDPETASELLIDYIGETGSAYDTQDEDSAFEEEYEKSSMIDDVEIIINDESSDGGSQSTIQEQEKQTPQQDVGDDEVNEDDVIIVGVKVANPAPVDVGLFHGQDVQMSEANLPTSSKIDAQAIVSAHDLEDSQHSVLTEERLRDRISAAEAAVNEGWHNISLTSTTTNHTHPEVLL